MTVCVCVHTPGPLGWYGVCVCVSICPASSSFHLHTISHVVIQCESLRLSEFLKSVCVCSHLSSSYVSSPIHQIRLLKDAENCLCLSVHVLICACVCASVHRAGSVWNCVAGEVLQLQQEGPLPVGKQLQQHRVWVQTQRHAHTHVGQQGDVCLKEEQL